MRSIVAFALASSLAFTTVMCSSSDEGSPNVDPGSGGLADGRFRGVLAGAGDLSGVVELNVTAAGASPRSLRPLATATSFAITGTITLNLPGRGPISVTGTLDLATNTATFEGTMAEGMIKFSGTYANGVIQGEAVSPFGSAPIYLTNEEVGGLKTYCGSFSGGRTGRWSILVAGSQAGVVFAASDGQVGGGQGTFNAGLMTVSLRPDGSATGGESAGQISGSWTYGGATGAFATSESACTALLPRGGDGGVPDGGPGDSGPPGTPELVYKVPGTVRVGHLAIAGTKLFYAVNHPYFQGKIQIGSVGVDGSAPADVVPVTMPMDSVAGLTATNAKVYWVGGQAAQDSRLFSVPTGGGAISDHGIVGGVSNADYTPGVSRLVNDGTSVFVSFYSSSTSALRSFGLDGSPLATLADQVGSMGIGFDGADLLFGEFNGVQRIGKNLVGPATVVSASSEYGVMTFAVNLVSDATNVYFLGNSSFATTLWRKPKAGGAVAPVIASVPGRARGLVLLDGFLYFAFGTSTSGQQGGPVTSTLMRVAASANNATATVIGPANVHDIVSDGTYVYYSDDTNLRRVRK